MTGHQAVNSVRTGLIIYNFVLIYTLPLIITMRPGDILHNYEKTKENNKREWVE
jgi:hypothetical protein